MAIRIDKCKGCGRRKPIVNTKYCLCRECNWSRLHPGEKPKTYELKRTSLPQPKEPFKRFQKPIKQHSKKSASVLKGDEETYYSVYELNFNKNGGECRCDECNAPLDPRFRDDSGKIVQRFRFSHILGKQAYPEYRHSIINFNFLCFKCHNKWEFGDKKSMKIYKYNQEIIKQLKS